MKYLFKYVLLLLLSLSYLESFAQQHLDSGYVCPPCHSQCDQVYFDKPGNCSTCGMKLMAAADRIVAEEFSFTSKNVRYSAELGMPPKGKPIGTIVIIPGHGKTDFVGGGQYYEVRQFFSRLGFATLVWDKKGCGKSEGAYEHHQSVESSAQEAVAAIKALKAKKGTTAGKIGLWGISRAGWICPLIINQYPPIAFWISVSGTDQFDTFRYMLASNLKIEGRSEEQVKIIMNEFDHYIKVLRHGGQSYDELVRSTSTLFNDPFYISMDQKIIPENEFQSTQEYYKTSGDVFDETTGVMVFVKDFDKKLMNVQCPVLAVFGEKDSQVNWRSTQALYQNTLAKIEKDKLETIVINDCNHNMQKCISGGLHENLANLNWAVCDGYYETMERWLVENGFAKGD